MAARPDAGAKAETQAIIWILEDKRREVMCRDQADYFIHDWQEITDQDRQMIFCDEQYPAIRQRQDLRRSFPTLSDRESG